MKKLQIILLTIFISHATFIKGQSLNRTHFINLGYDQIKPYSFFKIGYKVGFTEFKEFAHNFSAVTADFGLGKIGDKYIYAPSLTYNFYGAFYFVGLNSTYFFYDSKREFTIAPQIGLTYFNVINIGYSYILSPFTSEKSIPFRNKCFIVSLSIPIDLLRK